jgi:glycosyltransferase involved in cell wall biosynthesis
MKIAIFTPTFLPKCSGAEIFHHNLASQFVKMGHHPLVILPKSLHRRLAAEGWDLPYPTIPYPANLWSYFKRSVPLAFWLNRRALARLQRRHKFDVWHTVVLTPSGVCFADWQSRCGIPGLIRAVGDDVKAVAGAELPTHMGPLLRSRIPLAQRVVSLSRDMTADLERLGVPPDRIELVPNAVDHARFSAPADKPALRRVHGIPADAFVFLCVARNHPQKDLPTLLRAFKTAREAASGGQLHLILVGRGVPELRSDIAALGLAESTTLLEIQAAPGASRLPEYPPQALVDVYRAADAFVLSSLLEGFSTALLEAMAAGLPIVATRVPGIVDQVEEGKEGVLLPAQNSDALADAMGQIASDSHLASSLSDQAARRSMEFRWERVADKYLALYQKMISEADCGSR